MYIVFFESSFLITFYLYSFVLIFVGKRKRNGKKNGKRKDTLTNSYCISIANLD